MRIEQDIELCSVTNVNTKEKLMNALVKAGIPYAEEWEKIPLVKRKRFNGAKEVCVVITHQAKADQAKAIIEGLDDLVKKDIIY